MKVILGRAVVSATFQGSSTLIVRVAVALIFLAENPTLAAEAAIISEILRFLAASLQVPVTQEISLTISILVALSPLGSS